MKLRHLVVAISFTSALVFRSPLTSAGIVAVDTAHHPVLSTLTIDLYLNGRPGIGVFLGGAGPALVTGSGVLDIDLDASDTGTASLLSSHLRLDSFGPQTLDLGVLGTIDVRAD